MTRIAASFACLLLIAAPACGQEGAAAPPAVSSVAMIDPPRDAAHPARNQQLLIPSGGEEMNALFLLAAGAGPKPTLVLLHGLPGNERNLDLAQAVRRAGWNVLTFTYRGAWGSQGIFSIEHAIADAGAAMDFLRRPETLAGYDIDPARIVIAGHSMGGMAAAQQAARDDKVAGLVLLDAWDAGATARDLRAGGAAARDGFIAGLDDLGHAVGTVTAADLADELIRRGEPWRFDAIADRLARKPVLTIYATHGGAAENRAFAETLRGKSGARVMAVEIESDHAFADSRIRLAEEVVRWLEGISSGVGADRLRIRDREPAAPLVHPSARGFAMNIRVTLHEVDGADARQRGLALRAAAALEEAVNDPQFQPRVAAAPYTATMFSDGDESWAVPAGEVFGYIQSGAERGSAADGEVDLRIRLADLPEDVVGETTPGQLPFKTARWFIDGCIEDEDVVSPACHFIHEWLHVAGFYHCPDNKARGDVAYLVGDIVRDLLRERDKIASPRMMRLLEEAECGAGGKDG